MNFEVYRTRNKQWRWKLRAPNGKLIANAGESYQRRIDCLKAIQLVRASDMATVEVLEK